MQHENNTLPPEIAAVREALWFAPRNAGIAIEVLLPKLGDGEGMTDRTLVGSYQVTLACWKRRGQLLDVPMMLTVKDVAPNNPRRNDEFGLFMLQYDSGLWRMHIEPSEPLEPSEDPCPWNGVYQRLTAGILAQDDLYTLRFPEALIAASTVGQFLAEYTG